MRYEFAATTFVYDGCRFAIHFHEKIKKWLPPGGHVECWELPHQAALREVKEELGLDAKLLVARGHDLGIETVPLPMDILVEDIDKEHKHVDMIYAATVAKGANHNSNFKWVTLDEAADLGAPIDVLKLAKMGLAFVEAKAKQPQFLNIFLLKWRPFRRVFRR